MNISDTIKKRKSCRTFNNKSLRPADRQKLEQFMLKNNTGLEHQIVNFDIYEKTDTNKQLKINYGLVTGHTTYIFGKIKSDKASRLNYGYLMEKIVLKATEMNISTCWIGSFDNEYFSNITLEEGYEVPGMVILGYPETRPSLAEKFQRMSLSASKRLKPEKLFFDYATKKPLIPEVVKDYSETLEMVRLAPSSGNTQPWRIYYHAEAGEFHFYKKPVNARYEARGAHDLDMGIALVHFELSAKSTKINGEWVRYMPERMGTQEDLQYMISWKSL